jgi:hypothetical protein
MSDFHTLNLKSYMLQSSHTLYNLSTSFSSGLDYDPKINSMGPITRWPNLSTHIIQKGNLAGKVPKGAPAQGRRPRQER